MQIELHHLVTLTLPGVRHVNRHIVGSLLVQTALLVGQLKRGVGQAVAKGEKGLAPEEAIGAPRHAIVIERRQLAVIAIERDGQLARRVVVAQEHVGQCMTALLTSIPCLDDGVATLHLGHQRHG